MTTIMVTGVTGGLGKAVIEHLLQQVPAERIVGLARDPIKAGALLAKGVDIRRGDYQDAASLRHAFEGIDTLFLVSAVAFTDRFTQHLNVINAAKAAGVGHIFYTSIQRNPKVDVTILEATDSDLRTEQALRESGLAYTIVRHPLYMDGLPMMLGLDLANPRVAAPGGEGRIALTLRDELAQGAAALLTSSGPAIPDILLNAGHTITLQDFANSLGTILDADVPYVELSHDAFVEQHIAAGYPAPVAAFLASWFEAIRLGAFEETSDDLARLIGRPPTQLEPALRRVLGRN
ncbi:MAG: ytfG [Pseudomonas sp.]|nr:ytfG [Pseudomonas sp.]